MHVKRQILSPLLAVFVIFGSSVAVEIRAGESAEDQQLREFFDRLKGSPEVLSDGASAVSSDAEHTETSHGSEGSQASHGSEGGHADHGLGEASGGAAESAAALDPKDRYPGQLEKAIFFHQQGDFSYAVDAYLKVLSRDPLDAQEAQRALSGMAEVYYQKGEVGRSVSLLSQYMEHFPDDSRRVGILYQTGLMYREWGLYEEAIATFYRVLNSIVVTGEADVPRYLLLARRAQFEIARSYYDAGEWMQALSLLERIELLELSSTDRETILFYKAKAYIKVGERRKGLAAIDGFVRQYSSSELIPEMLYDKTELLVLQQRHEEAQATLMELLERGGSPADNVTENWRHWRKQAGNYFANYYFQRGEYLSALRLYQGIVVLDEANEWQLPIVFQIGLCFEKLGMPARAEESLQYVVQGLDEMDAGAAGGMDLALEHLQGRVRWRIEMLEWRSGLELKGIAAVRPRAQRPQSVVN